jgi:hypothetical protein
MGAVAEGHRFRVFAGAPGDGARFLDFGFERAEAGAFVGAVAERLALGATAGAPPIGAGFDFLDDWLFLENNGFAHARIVLDAFQFGKSYEVARLVF